MIESLDNREQPIIQPHEDLEEIVVNFDFSDQKVKVGLKIPQEEREAIIEFLRKNKDVFAWRAEDMKRISEDVVVHKLNMDPGITPIQE